MGYEIIQKDKLLAINQDESGPLEAKAGRASIDLLTSTSQNSAESSSLSSTLTGSSLKVKCSRGFKRAASGL